jgi:phasin family protein
MATKAPRAGTKKPVAKTVTKPKAVAPRVEPVKALAEPVEAELKAATQAVAETAPKAAEVVAETLTPTVEQAAAPVAEIIEDTATKTADTATKGTDIMETTIEKTQALFADFNERAKATVEKNTKLVADATEFAKGNVEALVESGKIAAKGFETLGQEAAEYSRKSFENATATLKSLSAVKTPADFFKLQSDYVRSAFDSVVAETSKNTEAFIKLAGDAAQPISSRFAVAVEKVKTAA